MEETWFKTPQFGRTYYFVSNGSDGAGLKAKLLSETPEFVTVQRPRGQIIMIRKSSIARIEEAEDREAFRR